MSRPPSRVRFIGGVNKGVVDRSIVVKWPTPEVCSDSPVGVGGVADGVVTFLVVCSMSPTVDQVDYECRTILPCRFTSSAVKARR